MRVKSGYEYVIRLTGDLPERPFYLADGEGAVLSGPSRRDAMRFVSREDAMRYMTYYRISDGRICPVKIS